MEKIKRKLGERIAFTVFGIALFLGGLSICLVSIPLLIVLVGVLTFPLGALLVSAGFGLLKESKYKVSKGGKNGKTCKN